MCAAAGVANLHLVDELDLVANARSVGAYLLSTLVKTLSDHPMVGEIRGQGMLMSLELVKDREGRQFFELDQQVAQSVVATMFELGVIARPMPQTDVIGIAPPLCLTRAEADIIVDVTKKAVDQVAA